LGLWHYRSLGTCLLIVVVAASLVQAQSPTGTDDARPALNRAIDAALAAPCLRGGIQAVIIQGLEYGATWY